ncbi:hypothetical protein [Zobellella iuensis]|uniref:Uncharacterized protein n=1 Tax=Zobellella iuensis TaxID=2803811 RepID=A0ABS1QWE1_9GAMM|nr:hypothetical protein [Zobellella iuensis]MBL1379183.1 hypothetical protein [Zobellella iuensis]
MSAITITRTLTKADAEKHIARHHTRVANIGVGIKALGEMLTGIDPEVGIDTDLASDTGHLLHEVGQVIVDSLNEIAEIEKALMLARETGGRK